MRRLHAPDGCPWDREQTHESLKRYLIEEAYEFIEAVDNHDPEHQKEELGDLLLQIVFHAVIAEEAGEYNMNDIVEGIVTKLERRHPHVFGKCDVSSANEVAINWDEIKREEKKERQASAIAGIPTSLPALLYANKLQSRAAKVGFDWDDVGGAIEKITEELDELKEARTGSGRVEEELGDLLFTVVNVARHFDIDPELALKGTSNKFERRFRYMEQHAADMNTTLSAMSLPEKDALWDQAKETGIN
jgi:tetrapyrrole methylase family protein/MazG family protein